LVGSPNVHDARDIGYKALGLFFLAELLHQFSFLPFLSRRKKMKKDELVQPKKNRPIY